jgi:hypothetical protein
MRLIARRRVSRVLGVAQRGVVVERADPRQSGVAGPGGVAALALEVIQERGDRLDAEVLDVQGVRLDAGALVRAASRSREVSR